MMRHLLRVSSGIVIKLLYWTNIRETISGEPVCVICFNQIVIFLNTIPMVIINLYIYWSLLKNTDKKKKLINYTKTKG